MGMPGKSILAQVWADYAIKNGDANMLELFYTDYLQRLYQ